MVTKVRSIISNVRETSLNIVRRAAVAAVAPTEKQAQLVLFAAGIIALGVGLSHESFATGFRGAMTQYEDARIVNAVNTVMRYLEGSFGALIMAGSGLIAICSAAFGQYKAALSCMIVAVGAFILRSVMYTFFDVSDIQSEVAQ